MRVSPSGERVERGVDVFGERVAGCLSERPGGGAAGVVPERERGVGVLGLDRLLSVEQRVEEREADDVRFGAGGELSEETVGGLGELRVELPPQLAGVGGERDFPGGLGVCEHAGEVAAQAGAFQWVGVAAFG